MFQIHNGDSWIESLKQTYNLHDTINMRSTFRKPTANAASRNPKKIQLYDVK